MWFKWCVVVLAVLEASAQQVNLYSQEKEAALGEGLAREIRKQTAPIDSNAVREYIVALGRRLAFQLPDTGLKWTFTAVLDSLTGRTREPVALPGGFIFVPAALILDALDEAEFAGMLAHAMAHVSERHGVRAAARGQIANLATIPLIFIGGWSGAGDRTPVLIPVGFLVVCRENELDADRVAVRIMVSAGYDPNALMRYIDRMQPASTDLPPARSAMPSHDERIATLEKAIRDLPPASYSTPNEEFEAIQQEVRRLMPIRTDEAPRLRRPPSLYHQ